MTADNQQGRTKKNNKYRLSYDSIYREKDWVNLTHEFKAEDNQDAIVYSQRFIRKQNSRSVNTPERFEITGIEKIIQETVKEKTVRINLS